MDKKIKALIFIIIVTLYAFQTIEKKTSKDFLNGIKHIVNEILFDLSQLKIQKKLLN